MSVSFSVKGDLREIRRHISKTQRHIIPKATTQALNKTGAKVKTAAVRGTAAQVKIPQKYIRERVFFKGRLRARQKRLEAVVLVKHAGVSVIRLKARQTRAGVTAGRKKFPGAFIATGAGGNRQVFRRKGRSRLPIEKVEIRIYPEVARQSERALRTVGAAQFPIELERAIRYQLSRLKP